MQINFSKHNFTIEHNYFVCKCERKPEIRLVFSMSCRNFFIITIIFYNFFYFTQAAAEYEDLAIPQHRIEYFKYRGTKVWDKKSRLDLVFGSSGDNHGKTIDDVMKEIDNR